MKFRKRSTKINPVISVEELILKLIKTFSAQPIQKNEQFAKINLKQMFFNVLLVLFGIPMNNQSRLSLNPMLFLYTPTRFPTECLTKQTTDQPAPTPQNFLLPSLNLHRLSSPRQLKLYFVWRVFRSGVERPLPSQLSHYPLYFRSKYTLVRLVV